MESYCTRQPDSKQQPWDFKTPLDLGLLRRIPKLYEAAGLPVGDKPHEVCCSNADLYYLSVDAWPKFGVMVKRAFTPRGTSFNETRDMLLNEVVVPITMRALRPAGLHEEQLCWQRK